MIDVWFDNLCPAPEGFIHTKTVEDTLRVIFTTYNIFQKNYIDILYINNDLGEDEEEGCRVLEYLEAWKSKDHDFELPNRICIHSINPVVKKRIQQTIDKLYRK